MLRKDRVFEALRSLCTEAAGTTRSAFSRRHVGFSAEEVAERASIDRTNASRDLNVLAQEGKIARIPGRPVLFTTENILTTHPQPGHTQAQPQPERPQTKHPSTSHPLTGRTQGAPLHIDPARPSTVVASLQNGAIVTSFETLVGSHEGLKVAIQQAKAAMLYPPHGLHTLLCGPSGVGKTTFARLMHAFALELKALPVDAPF
ncbi:MAG: sigma 54-interacting transcriptional regulator, partial [Chloroflexota bacterium]|nr:sigma 54-interacting transcriptional regulator [Chloroflexota bacterium]